MVKYIFENKKNDKFDAKIFLFDKKEKKFGTYFEENLSKNELTLIKETIKRENFPENKKDFSVISVGASKVILASFDESKADDLFFQKLGGKLSNVLFESEKAVYYVREKAEEAYHLAYGYELGSYRFDKYFTKKESSHYSTLQSLSFAFEKEKLSEKAYADFSAVASSVNLARDLVNEPANVLTPKTYADEIKKLKKCGLEIEILDEKELKKKDFNLLMAVAQASDNKPYVVVMKWIGNKKQKDFDLALVGKGVTFDSGGLNIKTGSGLEYMNYDMGGSAAVVGTLRALALTNSKANVIGVVGLVENAIAGNATRVNDVITSMSGQTVEIMNTDAEGRLVLADLLTYTQQKYQAKKIVDLATLTGAVLVCLSKAYAGLFSNHDKFAEELLKAGVQVDEKLWRLPVDEHFNKMLDSSVADMRNIGTSRWGGSSQGACFLQRFIDEGVQWAHLDIAGTADEDKGTDLNPKGATGFGIKVLYDYVKNNF
ncbi:MAG: leucyl aminopeptidase [Alphaproteobacteria bacterium]|nr:leucyl aminopeptidase [Alphaproteobacteria bacterium]